MSINNALNITKTGLTLQETVVSTVAQNLSGAGADSFQKLTIIAKDLPYTNQPPGAPTSNSGTTNEVGLQMGTGVRVAGVQRSLKTGDYKQTDDPLDLAIDGKGYYQIQLPNGDIGYTRVASFRVDSKSNNLSTIEGYSLYPNITVPPNAQELMVANDGTVEVSIQGNTNSYTTLGQISLATFVNPSGLKAIGDTMFLETPASGTPSLETPGTNNKGYIKQGYRETSNVNPVEEIIQLVISQQQYESLTKVVSTADEMMRAANQRIA
jgi:flagellar basal-body rod protein FlgG